jgi:protein TonB
MMRLWAESYAKTTPISSSAVFSVVTHALLIGAAVVGTRRAPDLTPDWIENRTYYLPPPDRAPGQEAVRETIKYVELAPEGIGAGFGKMTAIAEEKPTQQESSPTIGDLGRDLTTADAAPPLPGQDSVFSELEVDSSVARYPGSAAPAYPIEMLKQGIQGSVTTQYVVDTTGFADTSSLRIVRSTHPDFTSAVRVALPYMRFFPARVGSRKVRQLVEQEFTFKIEQAATQAAATKKPDEEKPRVRRSLSDAIAANFAPRSDSRGLIFPEASSFLIRFPNTPFVLRPFLERSSFGALPPALFLVRSSLYALERLRS